MLFQLSYTSKLIKTCTVSAFGLMLLIYRAFFWLMNLYLLMYFHLSWKFSRIVQNIQSVLRGCIWEHANCQTIKDNSALKTAPTYCGAVSYHLHLFFTPIRVIHLNPDVYQGILCLCMILGIADMEVYVGNPKGGNRGSA